MTPEQFIQEFKNDKEILDTFYELSGKYEEVYGDKADMMAIQELYGTIRLRELKNSLKTRGSNNG